MFEAERLKQHGQSVIWQAQHLVDVLLQLLGFQLTGVNHHRYLNQRHQARALQINAVLERLIGAISGRCQA